MPNDAPAWYLRVVDPEKMRKAREGAGLSQNGAAQATGVTLTTIQNWESGRRRNVSRPYLVAAARVYGVEPEDLVTDETPGRFRFPEGSTPPGGERDPLGRLGDEPPGGIRSSRRNP